MGSAGRGRADRVTAAECAALTALVALALALRVHGIRFGLPAFLHPDEDPLVEASAYFVLNRTVRPPRFDWPTLPMYLDYLVLLGFSAVGWVRGQLPDLDAVYALWKADRSSFYLTLRIFSAAIGAATVLPVWWLARELYGRRAALFAGVAMAIVPLHVLHSHYAVPDVQVTFWVACALAVMARILETDRPRSYVEAGLLVGIAEASKYNAFVLAVPLVAAHLLRPRDAPSRSYPRLVRHARLVLAGAVAVLAFFAISPYAALDLGRFLHDVRWQAEHMAVGHAGIAVSPWEHSWLFHLRHSIVPGLTSAGTAAALAALGFLALRRLPGDWMLLAWVVPYYLLMEHARGKPPPDYARAMLPLLPALAVALGTTGDALLGRATAARASPRRRAILVPAAAAGLALLAIWLTADAYLLSDSLVPDTREVARDWIESHVDGRETVYALDLDAYNPPIAAARGYLENPDWLREHPGLYVTSSFRWQRYEDDGDLAEARAFYRELFARGEPVQAFAPRWRTLGFNNPLIRIDRIR